MEEDVFGVSARVSNVNIFPAEDKDSNNRNNVPAQTIANEKNVYGKAMIFDQLRLDSPSRA